VKTATGVTAGPTQLDNARTSLRAGSTQMAIVATTIRRRAGAPYKALKVQVGGLTGVHLIHTRRTVTLHGRPAVVAVAAVLRVTTRDAGTGLAGKMMKATDVQIMQTTHGAIALAASALAGTTHGESSAHRLVSQQLIKHAVLVEGVLMGLRPQLQHQHQVRL